MTAREVTYHPLGDEASSGFCASVTSTGPPHSGNSVHAVMCRLRRAPTRRAAAPSQPESGDRGAARADDDDHEAGGSEDGAAEAGEGNAALSEYHGSASDSGSDRDIEEGEDGLGGASGQQTQPRTRQPARSAAAAAGTAPRAAARNRKQAARKASAAELRAFPVFVSGTLAVTRDAEVKLRALGKKETNDELASKHQSLFGIYEWLAKASDTPPAPFQRAIQALPGATSKRGAGGYNVWRAFKVEESLSELGALLETAEMQAVLSEHHKATLKRSDEEKRLYATVPAWKHAAWHGPRMMKNIIVLCGGKSYVTVCGRNVIACG